ncbi:hypothetical protein J4218_03615 [Candidatus Pacearchaeota archaeon]|nr:hypothetical protein [Candidatus Pacearchaeota archaeon]
MTNGFEDEELKSSLGYYTKRDYETLHRLAKNRFDYYVNIGKHDFAKSLSRRTLEVLLSTLQREYSRSMWEKLSSDSPICRSMEIGYTDARIGLKYLILLDIRELKK